MAAHYFPRTRKVPFFDPLALAQLVTTILKDRHQAMDFDSEARETIVNKFERGLHEQTYGPRSISSSEDFIMGFSMLVLASPELP